MQLHHLLAAQRVLDVGLGLLPADEQHVVEQDGAARLPLAAAHQPEELALGHEAAARVLDGHRASQPPLHAGHLEQRVRLALALI